MKKEIIVKVKLDYIQKYKEGYPLVLKESLIDWDKVTEEGVILKLVDHKKKFILKAYHGIQNKGFGWALSSNEEQGIDVAYFENRIKKALEYRKDLFNDKNTTAFRVFNGEGDGIGGITIDYYDEYYLITWYSIGIYKLKEDILEALKLSVSYKGVYQKKRFNTKGMYLLDGDDFLFGQRAPEPLIVKENGVKFAIYLDDGAMVGVFLDQRDVRRTLRDKYAQGKTLLNTFSYTGVFSVFGALGGTKKTTSVDLAKRSLIKTQEHFSINAIEVQNQDIIVEDVFNYFKYALKKNLLFDIVVLDPPSFARSKKHTFSASKDYVKLLKEAIQITNKNGLIIASTNSANFSMMRFSDFVAKAFRELKGRYKVEESFSLPKDFRVNENFKEGDYLKVMFIRKLR